MHIAQLTLEIYRILLNKSRVEVNTEVQTVWIMNIHQHQHLYSEKLRSLGEDPSAVIQKAACLKWLCWYNRIYIINLMSLTQTLGIFISFMFLNLLSLLSASHLPCLAPCCGILPACIEDSSSALDNFIYNKIIHWLILE